MFSMVSETSRLGHRIGPVVGNRRMVMLTHHVARSVEDNCPVAWEECVWVKHLQLMNFGLFSFLKTHPCLILYLKVPSLLVAALAPAVRSPRWKPCLQSALGEHIGYMGRADQ